MRERFRRAKALPQFVEVRSSGLARQPEGVALSLSKWLPWTEQESLALRIIPALMVMKGQG